MTTSNTIFNNIMDTYNENLPINFFDLDYLINMFDQENFDHLVSSYNNRIVLTFNDVYKIKLLLEIK